MRLFKYISIFIILCGLFFYFETRQDNYVVLSGKTMGTYYNIKIRTKIKHNMLNKKVQEELELINQQMSVFDNSSELSLINQNIQNEWQPLSPEMSEVMKKAYDVYLKSNGSFDPTVGKLVDLWGFGAGTPKNKPSEEEIKKVLAYTGFNKVKFKDNFTRLKKTQPDIYINLSAIAKGYGVQRIAEMLSEIGYKDFVVEIGGEVVARGRRDELTDGWNVAVSKPTAEGVETAFVVTLKNSAVATSGDYRNFFIIDNKRYSHTISPKTGYPSQHNIASATVFHKNCTLADAYATALMEMGENKALEFANQNGLSVILFIRDTNDNIKTLISNEAEKLIEAQQ